jgi:GNAT superfamily N-acetyltransferase
MGITYFKRYRMEFNLIANWPNLPVLQAGYALHAWQPSLFDSHVEVKFRSFRYEIDANLFPCFHDREGCEHLMREITQRESFLPGTTWLVTYQPQSNVRPEPCGTIQGLIDGSGLGAVQNVGVIPAHRGHGLGSWLLYYALTGFRAAGLERVYLEVTAQNLGAVRLYQRLGWRKVRTVYKAADVAIV